MWSTRVSSYIRLVCITATLAYLMPLIFYLYLTKGVYLLDTWPSLKIFNVNLLYQITSNAGPQGHCLCCDTIRGVMVHRQSHWLLGSTKVFSTNCDNPIIWQPQNQVDNSFTILHLICHTEIKLYDKISFLYSNFDHNWVHITKTELRYRAFHGISIIFAIWG